MGGKVRSFHDLSERTTLAAPPRVHQPGTSSHWLLWDFLMQTRLIKSLTNWWLAQSPGPLPSWRSREGCWQIQPLNLALVCLGPALILKLSRNHSAKNHLLSINSGMVESGLLWTTQNVSITSVIQEIPRVLRNSVSATEDKDQIYEGCSEKNPVINGWLQQL